MRHPRHVTSRMVEVAVPRALFEQILARLARLTPRCDTGERGGQEPSRTHGRSARACCAQAVGSVAHRSGWLVDQAALGSAFRILLRCDMTASSFSVENLLSTAPMRGQLGHIGSE